MEREESGKNVSDSSHRGLCLKVTGWKGDSLLAILGRLRRTALLVQSPIIKMHRGRRDVAQIPSRVRESQNRAGYTISVDVVHGQDLIRDSLVRGVPVYRHTPRHPAKDLGRSDIAVDTVVDILLLRLLFRTKRVNVSY